MGYFFTRENTEIAQKVQLALTRLEREFLECSNCNAGNTYPYPLTTPFTFENIIGNRSIALDGSVLRIGPQNGALQTLVDNVSDFRLARDATNGVITITLTMAHGPGQTNLTFESKVLPRNTRR